MSKLLTLFVIALSLVGFNSASYAAGNGAEADNAAEKVQMTTEEAKAAKEKKKKKGDEEEPECE